MGFLVQVNTVFRHYASEEIKQRYLPRLAENTVRPLLPSLPFSCTLPDSNPASSDVTVGKFWPLGALQRERRLRAQNDC